MTVNLKELIDITTTLLNVIRDKNGVNVEVDADYYWNISSDEIYNVYNDPQDMSIGQLSDDWETLQKAANSNNLTPYDLQRISAIFSAISIQHPI